MKNINIKIALLSFFLLSVFSCKKAEPLIGLNPPKIAKLEIRGLVLVDTLEFVLDGKVIGQGIDNKFTANDRLVTVGKEIEIIKKVDKKPVGKIVVTDSQYVQIKKIFYDGTTFTDKIELTPVSNPESMGIRMAFSTPFSDFYGGPVDVEIFEYVLAGRVATYISKMEVKNITAVFGDFFELPKIIPENGKTKSYRFKVYKAGTKELPYTSMTKVFISNPANNYGSIVFKAGDSQLISIKPVPGSSGGVEGILSGYDVQDYSYAFK